MLSIDTNMVGMTINGVMAVILRYSTEFDSFRADYIKMVEYRPILSSTIYRFIYLFAH